MGIETLPLPQKKQVAEIIKNLKMLYESINTKFRLYMELFALYFKVLNVLLNNYKQDNVDPQIKERPGVRNCHILIFSFQVMRQGFAHGLIIIIITEKILPIHWQTTVRI